MCSRHQGKIAIKKKVLCLRKSVVGDGLCEIIDESAVKSDEIAIGSTVKVLDIEFDEENEYRVVGSAEANPAKGLISDESPVGKALLGRKAGDEVTVEAPAGEIKLKIISISR